MNELSIMVDESGEWGRLSKYYLITLVFHDQSEPIRPHIERYERHLADASLPDIPFPRPDHCSMAMTTMKPCLWPTIVGDANLQVSRFPCISV